MPMWIGKIEHDRGTADIRQSFSMRNPFIADMMSLNLPFIRFRQRWRATGTSDAASHADTLHYVQVRAASGTGRAWAGRVCHASTHSLSMTPTVRSLPQLYLHFGMRAYVAAGPAISAATLYKYSPPFLENSFLFGTVTTCGYRREVRHPGL